MDNGGQKAAKYDPRRVWWDEKDCERMTRSEFVGVRGLLGAVSYIASAKEDLDKRLECLPYGKGRMAMLLGAAQALANDLIGTMTIAQAKQMQNVMRDMEMRMVPKLTPGLKSNVLMPAEDAKTLISCAQYKCRDCVAYGEEARQCELYKVLEAITPLDNYGDGLTCPYYRADFE